MRPKRDEEDDEFFLGGKKGRNLLDLPRSRKCRDGNTEEAWGKFLAQSSLLLYISPHVVEKRQYLADPLNEAMDVRCVGWP